MQKKPKKDPVEEKSLSTKVTKPLKELTCIPADEDALFMNTDEARGVRLQLDYLKAETIMKNYGIEHTIVVFGSTCIVEPKIALDALNKIKKKLEITPHSQELLDAYKNAESIERKSIYYDEARKFGQLIGKSGKGPDDSSLALMTGGGTGIMEAANRGALDVGAKSIGLNINLPRIETNNPYITPELCFKFHYFAIRKLHLFNRSKAFVFFPGGYGTMDELFEILTLIQTGKSKPMPIVLVGRKYWEKVIDFNFLVEEGVIIPANADIVIYAKDAREAWNTIIKWHIDNKTPLF